MKLSIVIVTFGNLGDVSNCIESIKINNDLAEEVEIIVVDNTEDNSVYDYLREKFNDITIYKNENTGFGSANNIGFKLSSGDFILFLNPDTVIYYPVFKEMLSMFQNDHNLGLLGVKNVDSNLKTNMSFYWSSKKDILSQILIKIYNRVGKFNEKKMYTIGSNMLFRRSCFIDIGGFDNNIFLFGEEKDVMIRIDRTKWKRSYNNQIKIIHLEGRSTKGGIFSFEENLKSSNYLAKKHNYSLDKEFKSIRKYLRVKKTLCRFNKNERDIFNKKIKILNAYLLQHISDRESKNE